MDQEKRFDELLEQAAQGKLNRRAVLKRAVALGLSAPAIAAVLAACGGDEDTTTDDEGGTGADTTPATGTDESDGEETPAGETDGEDAPAAEGGERGGAGQLRLIYWQAPTILNPHLAQGTKDFHASRIALQPLADFTADGEMILVLAAEEPTLENGLVAEDGTSVTWRLRDDVYWHDGEQFTAEDVVFTWEYVMDEATTSVSVGYYETIESIDIIDDFTVQVNFTEPEPAWSKAYTGSYGMVLPEHILRDYIGAEARNAEFNLMPIGTGPYRVADFRPGDVVVYEMFEDYWEPGKPHFDSIEIKGGGDAASAARAVLQTEEADWAWNIQVEEQVLGAMESAGTGQVVVWEGGGTEKLLFNFSDPQTEQDGQRSHVDVPHPHLAERDVRQAIAYAVERDVIAEQLYGRGGEATASTINIPTNVIPDDISWEFNLEESNSLLDEAGATRGGDGIRELNGRRMSWVFQTSINSIRQKTQEIIKNATDQLGIELELKAIDAAVYFSGDPGNDDTTAKFYADLEMYTNSPSHVFPIDWYRRYLSTEIAQEENAWSSFNYLRYQNPEFDALFEDVSDELDPDAAEELFQEMQRVIWRDVAELGLIARTNISTASGTLTGFNPSPWRPEVSDIADWQRS